MKGFFSIVVFLGCFNIYAQNIDSLKEVLNALPSDTNRIKLLSRLSYEVRPFNPQEALDYAIAGIKLADSLKYTTGLIMHYLNVVDVQVERAQYLEADSLLDIVIRLSEEKNDLNGLGGAYYNKGLIYEETGDYEKSIEVNIRAIQIYEQLDEDKMIGACYEGIGIVYGAMGNADMSVQYFRRALRSFEKAGVMRGVSSSYLNIAGYHEEHGAIDSALFYYEQGYQVAREINAQRLMAWNLQGLGSMNAIRNRVELAEIQYRQALSIFTELDDVMNIASMYHSIAELHYNKEDFAEALRLYEESLEISELIGHKQLIRDNAGKIADIFKLSGDFESALEYYILLKETNDSLLNESNIRAIADMEAKYQNQQKQKQIELQTLEIEKKNAQNRILIGGLLSSVLLISFLIIIYLQRMKTKSLEKQKLQALHEIEKQELKLETKERAFEAFLEGQEGERKRIAEELHDGLGGTLAGIKHKIEITSMQSTNGAALKDSITSLDDACITLRNISHNLMPPTVQSESFRSILENHLEEVQHMGEMKVFFNFSGDETIDLISDQVKMNSYRIIQEMIYNAYKHAQAERLELQVLLLDDHINIIVEDNGKGFDVYRESDGIGMTNIRSRLEIVDGKIEIDSKEGRGTIIMMDIPFC